MAQKAARKMDGVYQITTQVLERYIWLETNKIGTIYKTATPEYVVYPSIILCPEFPPGAVTDLYRAVNWSALCRVPLS